MIFLRLLLLMLHLCSCKRCTRVKVKCEKMTGTQQRTCKKCANLKEKCKWPETEAGTGEAKEKGKGKQKEMPAVTTSPQGGEKRKRKKMVKVVVNNKVEEVAGPSGSGSRKALLEGLTQLVGAVGELTGEVHRMTEAHKTAAKANNGAGIALKMFLEECWFFATPIISEEEEESEEEVDQEEVDAELKKLRQEMEETGMMVQRPSSSPVRTFCR